MLQRYLVISLFGALILLNACDTEVISSENPADLIEEIVDNPFFVTEEVAVLAAEDLANKYDFEFLKLLKREAVTSKKNDFKKVEHVLPLKTSKNEVALYLINLENGGFTIVPADKRLNPILAYSDTNKMPITLDEPLPGGLKIWLNANIAAVDSVRNKKEKNNSIHKAWETLLTTESKYKSMPDPDPDPPCEDEIYEVGPLLQTTWGQDEGYNNAAPPGSCTTTTNGRVLTGCVATAIAQVMRYHESPASYNWNSMPDGAITPLNQPSGTNEIAQLMRDVGDAVNMMWGCHASGAYGTSMEPAIENVFNYSSSTDYQAFDMWDLKDDINSFPRKPALIAASDSQVGGHVWVADGSRMYYIYDSNCIANGYLSFHMNWGWEGEFNAWYQVDNFSPGNFDFDTGIYQLIGIKP